MLSAGLAMEISMVKSTSGWFKPGPRAPEWVKVNVMGLRGEKGKEKGGSRVRGPLSFPVTHNGSAEKPRSLER